MKHTYLQVTYRNGRPLAAYYYLPRRDGEKVARTSREEEGLLVDYTADGKAMGIEITSPASIDLAELNRLLVRLGCQPATPEDLAPLHVA